MATYEHNPQGLPGTDLRYTPVLRGGVYCSPACGAGCKKKAYDRAKNSADRLANRLGHGWVPEVFENLGWHYSVSKGHATVRQQDDGNYSAELDIEGVKQIWLNDFSDPRDAVTALLAELNDVLFRASMAKANLELDPIGLEN